MNIQMKFRIEKEILSTKTNIRGKVLEENVRWVVYRPIFFGLERVYLEIFNNYAWENQGEVRVEYRLGKRYATRFHTRLEAERLIEAIQEEPDRFVRYK